MHLWTDYEGKTIAGDYPLSKLLRSEGRNAFFSASNPKGTSAVVRLTEAHFDESEMLKRWSKVVDLHQPSLIAIEKFGETSVDGVTLAYAVLEPNDANLQDVLRERPLTSAETLQVAKNVASALASLHANGLVHEHVDAANVLAVGEEVKLRSDCVRECVADQEFSSAEHCAQLQRKDVQDLGALLLRCLTLEHAWTPTTRLPAPFDQIVPRALNASWTLSQILSALEKSGSAASAAAAASAASAARESKPLVPESVLSRSPAAPSSATPPLRSQSTAAGSSASTPIASTLAASEAAAIPQPGAQETSEEAPRLRPRTYVPPVEHATLKPRSVWVLGLAAALLILLGWYFLFRSPTKPTPIAGSTSSGIARSNAATPPTAAAPSLSRLAVHPPTPKPSATVSSALQATSAQPGWRVIAYTYNREAPAQAQAARMAGKHPGLHPQVFSPKGRAPYLVALSGPLTQPEAKALQKTARRKGAPRDTFIRRY